MGIGLSLRGDEFQKDNRGEEEGSEEDMLQEGNGLFFSLALPCSVASVQEHLGLKRDHRTVKKTFIYLIHCICNNSVFAVGVIMMICFVL